MATKKSIKIGERMAEFTKEAKEDQVAAQDEDEKLFATRIPKAYVKAIKVYAVQNDITLKDFLTQAIEEAMKKRGIL